MATRTNGRTSKVSLQKRKILGAGASLFFVKGYVETSLRDISDACGFEPGNIYNYFSSKEELLFMVVREEGRRLMAIVKELEDDSSSTPTEQLRTLIAKHLDEVIGPSATRKLIIDAELWHLTPKHREEIIAFRDCYDKLLRNIIARGMKTGEFVETDPKLAANVIASAIIRCATWYSPKGRLSVGDLADFIAGFVFNGLAVRK